MRLMHSRVIELLIEFVKVSKVSMALNKVSKDRDQTSEQLNEA